ncbi:hypothetical protein HNR44_002673 [Geomicrobium halophilum]|uniref:Phr family secreted Rap phosphatase inhibitor n=1 Tax=Geomicrobium halophilum TaxID=549000 RepID=A0A841PZW8_9BACL|nr:hypothetical protein [Geomicrobium halophilum]MBB6450683.1 hypothetical protein [Geomicrobium halophilum]
MKKTLFASALIGLLVIGSFGIGQSFAGDVDSNSLPYQHDLPYQHSLPYQH